MTQEQNEPIETLHQRLKRLSQSSRTGERFVKGSNLGPITVHSIPATELKPPDEPLAAAEDD
jgi:hypothetical protein